MGCSGRAYRTATTKPFGVLRSMSFFESPLQLKLYLSPG